MSKIQYFPIELHSHTYHSDAKFSPEELLEAAKDFGYEAIFLTDHNTNSGLDEIYENDLDKKILPCYQGIEWTTFFGHMLILGSKEAGDYTQATIDNIEACIDKISAADDNIVIGMAHPYDIGNPICTGCHFEFIVDDYSKFNYIELFNSSNSELSKASELAYRKWTDLLKEGYKLSAIAGRDWHSKSESTDTVAVNMLGIDGEISQEKALAAIKNNRSYVTYGPILDMDFAGSNLGDSISSGNFAGSITISKGAFKNFEHIGLLPEKLLIYNNEKIIHQTDIFYNQPVNFDICPENGYLRIEIEGKIKGKDNCKILITSPIYVN